MYCENLKTIDIPNSVTMIGESSFQSCIGIESVTIGNSVSTIEAFAFGLCTNLKEINFGNSVSTIGAYAFSQCDSLTSIYIPNSTKYIQGGAFADCANITSVTLGNSVDSIEKGAFACPLITTIYCQAPIPPKCGEIFSYYDDIYTNATLYVPIGSKSDYAAADIWCNFFNIEETDFSGVRNIEHDNGITVTTEGNAIIVNGAESGSLVSVFTTAGVHIYSGCEPVITGLAPGLYIVKVGNFTAKVLL